MSTVRHLLLAALVLGLVGASAADAAAQAKRQRMPRVGPPKTGPWYVDDEAVFDNLMAKLTAQAKAGKPLAHDALKEKIRPGNAGVTPAKPGDKPLSPEEVYKLALPSVFVIGSVLKDKKSGEWLEGRYGTAWAVAADGVLVTNWHLFDDLEDGEVFGAADHKGNVYPLTDFLGGDKIADIAVVRVAGSGFAPLPVATAPAEVGSWVGVLGHPADHYFAFTQGYVTRYNRNKTDDGKTERWMSVTAEYAGGSSGSPVLNRYGAVVGMAALTVTLDSGDERPREEPVDPRPQAPPPREVKPAIDLVPGVGPREEPKDRDRPEVRGPVVQMVVKMTVPAASLMRTLGPPAGK